MARTALAQRALLLALLSLSLLSPAQAQPEHQTITLQQALDYALQNNGELKALREEKGLRDAGKLKAGLIPNPTLDLEAGTGTFTGSSAESSLALGISQEFPLAGQRHKRLAVAEQELKIYRWQLADRERLLRDGVQSAFLDALLARKRAELADRAIELNRQLLEVSGERLTAGDIPELELNLVRVELARSEGARIDRARDLHRSLARLWALLGLPGGETRAADGDLDTEAIMTASLDELKRLARSNRPDLKAIEAETARDQADLILARAEGIPNLTAGLTVRRDTTATTIGPLDGRDTAYTIGVKLSLPMPLFDRNQAGIQAALARQGSNASRLQSAAASVEREVETAYTGYLNSGTVLALYKGSIMPQLEENLQLTREAYRLGEVGILAVIREQKNFIEVSEGYLAALYDRRTALARLATATATEFSGGAQ